MSFFKGRELYSVDDKGRVNIPAKMRKELTPDANETFVVTRGLDEEPCIYAYPLDEWQKMEKRLQQLNQFNEQQRFFIRTMLMWTDEVTLDKQCRISLPRNLMEFSGIGKSALILGAMDHLEIWNPEFFETYKNKRPESFAAVAQLVMGLNPQG